MKNPFWTLIFASMSYLGFSQVTTSFRALAEGAIQLELAAAAPSGQLFGFRMDSDGILRIIANGSTSSGVEVMQINDDTKNVGIGGTAISNVRLLGLENDFSNSPTVGVTGQASGAGTGSRFGVSGTASGNSGNRYGVYGTAATGTGHWGVYCSGDFYHTGSFTSTSDGRLKSNIQDIDQVLSTVMSLRPRRYNFKQDVKGLVLAKGPQIGFVAQEVEEVLPDLVETNLHDLIDQESDGDYKKMEIKSINYIAIIPLLTKAIQEQQALIDKLEQRITELESKE